MRRLITNGSLCALKRTSCAEAADFRLVPEADLSIGHAKASNSTLT